MIRAMIWHMRGWLAVYRVRRCVNKAHNSVNFANDRGVLNDRQAADIREALSVVRSIVDRVITYKNA